MKKLVLLFLIFSLNASIVFKQDKIAYYCESPNAKKYHFSKECKGLQNCTHVIVKSTISEAKKLELTVCLLENN